MKTGYYGTWQERDEVEATRRAINELRHDFAEREPSSTGLPHGAKVGGRMTSAYLCTVKATDPDAPIQEHSIEAGNNSQALLRAIHWIRGMPSKTLRTIEEVDIINLDLPGETSGTRGTVVYSWKRDGLSIEEEFERVICGLLTAQLERLEPILDEFHATTLRSKHRDLEALLRKVSA